MQQHPLQELDGPTFFLHRVFLFRIRVEHAVVFARVVMQLLRGRSTTPARATVHRRLAVGWNIAAKNGSEQRVENIKSRKQRRQSKVALVHSMLCPASFFVCRTVGLVQHGASGASPVHRRTRGGHANAHVGHWWQGWARVARVEKRADTNVTVLSVYCQSIVRVLCLIVIYFLHITVPGGSSHSKRSYSLPTKCTQTRWACRFTIPQCNGSRPNRLS